MDFANDNRTILSISDLNSEVALMLSRSFGVLWLEGEISNFARPASGHFYFSLKDQKAQVRCAMFRNRNLALRLKPSNGMLVRVRAKIGLYEPRGEFQIIVEHMEEAGAGELQQQFEALKAKLSAAGLFDTEHKKPLPKLPTSIGVITSPTGAAIRDILQVLGRRAPQIPVYIYPVAVQGKAAKTQIESAIRLANLDKRCEVLIVGRGGGSIEDLWSFNESNVVQAIFESEIPIISGVGHEVDTTIADYTADVRAATPSVAAELAVPDLIELRQQVLQKDNRLKQMMQGYLYHHQQSLRNLNTRLANHRPAYRLQQQQQRLDELEQRANRAIKNYLERQQAKVRQLETLLTANSPKRLLLERKQKLNQLRRQLSQHLKQALKQKENTLALLAGRLHSASPLNTLQRGYSITQDSETGKVLQTADDANIGQEINIRLHTGSIKASVTAVNKQLKTPR